MCKTILLSFLVAFSSISQAQGPTFYETVKQLFFGVDISGDSIKIYEDLRSIPQLKNHDNGVRQMNLNTSILMKSETAWSSKQKFTFTQSPISGLTIEEGNIEVVVGESKTQKKVFDIVWRIEFATKQDARKYFTQLKSIFEKVSTRKRYSSDSDEQIAEFSSSKEEGKAIKDIMIFLGQSIEARKPEIHLIFGNDLMNE